MEVCEISYTKWKSVVDNEGWPTSHVWQGRGTVGDHSSVMVYTGHRDLVFFADVLAADDADWTAGYKPASVEAPGVGEALFSLLTNLVEDQPKSATLAGMAAVTVMDIPPGASDYFESFESTSGALVTTYLDIWVGDTLVGPLSICWLVGGSYRVRTDAANGSALHLSVVDRDDLSGVFVAYGLSRTTLDVVTIDSGDPATAVSIRGQTSAAESNVLADLGGNSWAITFYSTYTDGQPTAWVANEAVDFLDGAGAVVATGTASTWTEGDVLLIQTHVRNKWVEGYETGAMKPGGTKPLPAGYYMRITNYNAHASEDLRITVEFQVGLE